MRRIWLLPLLALLFAPAARADDGERSLEKLQGTWKIVKYVNHGKDESPSKNSLETLTIEGKRYRMERDGEVLIGTLKLDDSAKPGKISATIHDTQEKDKVVGEVAGIYKLEGDELTVCWGEDSSDRPAKFASDKDSKTRLIVLKKR